jgi:hypothetical protein
VHDSIFSAQWDLDNVVREEIILHDGADLYAPKATQAVERAMEHPTLARDGQTQCFTVAKGAIDDNRRKVRLLEKLLAQAKVTIADMTTEVELGGFHINEHADYLVPLFEMTLRDGKNAAVNVFYNGTGTMLKSVKVVLPDCSTTNDFRAFSEEAKHGRKSLALVFPKAIERCACLKIVAKNGIPTIAILPKSFHINEDNTHYFENIACDQLVRSNPIEFMSDGNSYSSGLYAFYFFNFGAPASASRKPGVTTHFDFLDNDALKWKGAVCYVFLCIVVDYLV